LNDSAEEILQTAAELFATNGYRGTSLASIAERVGITAAAIYYHFRSKEDLLFSYLDRSMRDLMARSEAAQAALASPAERLHAFTSVYVTFHLELLDKLAPSSSGTYGIAQLFDGLTAANGSKMSKLFWEYIDSLRAVISDGVTQGQFRTTNVTASAFAVIGMIEHAGLWFRRQPELGIEGVAALYASHALKMLSPTTEGPR
jgi:AcrR family transcriptional regulator